MSARLIPSAEPFFFPGDRTGCLLVHGFTGVPKEMRWLGEHLATQGRTVLGIRLFGHATRPEDMIRARWPDWLANLEDGWHILSGMTERIFVIGLSLGGVLSLTFAAEYPVAGVVAIAAPHHLPADPRLRFVKALALIKPYNPKGSSDWHDQEAFQQHTCYPEDPTRAFAELRDVLVQMRATLPKVTAPALLIYSHQDQTVREEEHHMELIRAALGSSVKESVWVENSGHVITRDQERPRVFAAVGDFITRFTPSPV